MFNFKTIDQQYKWLLFSVILATFSSFWGEKCVSAATITYNFKGFTDSNSYRYDPVSDTTTNLAGLPVTGSFSFDPDAPVSVHEGQAAYYGQSPAVEISISVLDTLYKTIGDFQGYSYVYLRNFPWYTPANSWDRFLVETLGYTHNTEQQIFAVFDFYDTNGDALSTPGLTPGLPDIPKFENNSFFLKIYNTNLKRDIIRLSGLNSTVSAGSDRAVPEPFSLVGSLAAATLGAAMRRHSKQKSSSESGRRLAA